MVSKFESLGVAIAAVEETEEGILKVKRTGLMVRLLRLLKRVRKRAGMTYIRKMGIYFLAP